MRLTKTCGRLPWRPIRLTAVLLLGLSGLITPLPLGQTAAHGQVASPGVPVPSFWDPRRRPERPDLRLTLIRFVSEVDYPPFNYAAADGNPAGFNIELARLICEELKVDCTMQMRRFDTLIEALN
jgi:polar amino acid transport system substrate-binding protein